MNTDIQLSLTVEEVNAVLQTLGNLPTSSGAYPLMMKIKQQGQAQADRSSSVTDVSAVTLHN